MNWVDAVVLIVWAGTGLWGVSAGLLGVGIPVAMVIIGLAIASRVATDVGNIFSGLSGDVDLQSIGGFVLIFLALLIVGGIIGIVAGLVLQKIPLFGPLNRFGGLAGGIIIGFVLLSGILTGVQKFPNDNTDSVREAIEDSPLGSFLSDNFDVVIRGVKLIPSDWDQ